MNTLYIRLVLLGMYVVSGGTAARAGASFRIVSYMDNQYGGPVGITEGSPRIFYFSSGSNPQGAFSITPHGSKTMLGKVTGYFQAPLFSAANGRFFSATQLEDNPGNVVSFGSTAGSERTYPAQDLVPALTENLPDGSFVGIASSASTGLDYVVNVGANGAVTPIYEFPVSQSPRLGPIYASDGNYYGTYAISNGSGYVFRLTPSGTLTTVLSFPANTFSYHYPAPMLQASDGNLYGVTPTGGLGYGTIYKLTLSGQYTLLYTFPKGPAGIPDALIEGGDGNLYGATLGDGGGNSLLFSVTTAGQYTLLYKMANLARDGNCDCHLIQGSDGIFYGTALAGGTNGGGSIFALNAGLPKPPPRALQFTPTAGPVGEKVLIWGTNLLSASAEFNGTAAKTVSSSGPNYVWAVVPAGATTGPITITTPGGTFTTSANFTVR
jgi:uncharacterized repeat protein (TIGR03803 family)